MQKLTDTEYKQIPIFNQIKYLAELISEKGELKLTAKGFLPTKIVADIYAKGFLKDEFIESGLMKLYKETDSMTVNLTRIILELSGIIKKRSGKLSLTKAGEKTLADNTKLFQHIFKIFTSKFNWGYYDGYGPDDVAQFGYGFSLILLSKYGNVKRLDRFYAEKYFKAFPVMMDQAAAPTFGTVDDHMTSCYCTRTFPRFLYYFGLINREKVSPKWGADAYITKTGLFDKSIKVKPHNPQG